MKNFMMFGAAAAAIAMAAPASAEAVASAATDLNLRSGPGVDYAIVDVIPNNEAVIVDGCFEPESWCKVNYDGTEGWAYGAYLITVLDGQQVPVIDNVAALGLPAIAYTAPAGAQVVVTQPVGALVQPELVTLREVRPITPVPETVTYYIETNPVEPVILDGEVVLGATLPETVTFYEVPDTAYRYVNVNGQYVLVAPETRQVVYIDR